MSFHFLENLYPEAVQILIDLVEELDDNLIRFCEKTIYIFINPAGDWTVLHSSLTPVEFNYKVA